jgi:hypothetical protein
MTIYELANGVRAEKVPHPSGFRALREEFPPDDSDFLVAEKGQLVIAINHKSGKFAISRVGCCILGTTDQELTPGQLLRLQNASVF